MKKFLLLFAVAVTFIGCSIGEDDNPKFHLELLPVHSATFPAEFTLNQTYDIPIYFVRPSTCHAFEGFYYLKEGNTRTIAVQTNVIENDQCVSAPTDPVMQLLKIKITTSEEFIFKLWKGKSDSGEDVYEEVHVPVAP